MKRGLLCAAALSAGLWMVPGLEAQAAPKPETEFTLPHDASVDGFRIDHLIYEDAWLEAPLMVVLTMWLLFAVFAYGRKHKAVYDHGGFKHPIAAGLCLVAVVTLVADDALSWYESNRDLAEHFYNYADAEQAPDVVRIEVDAHQWAWAARYAGPDKKFNTDDDILTFNDVRVPVGSPVIIELASTDVIHDFYLPNMRVKQDAMPGMINRMMFTAKETGEYDIGCAQHCGLNHYKMKGLLTVLPKADFQQWANKASANSSRLFDPGDRIAHWGWDWTWKKGE